MLSLDLTRLPTLTTPRLVLREVHMDDAPAFFAMRSDPEVMRYVHRPMAKTMDDAIAFITRVQEGQRANTCAQWAMTLKERDSGAEAGEMIGVIGTWRIDLEHHRGELGYTLARDHWGQGLMSEAIATVMEQAFNVFKLHSVEAWTEPRNVASVRALEKNGFVREAYYKENIFWDGEFCDTVVYGRLAAK
ncbi:MAG: GNAT family N-acetyltransferase [Flavobacteriales bacterium]|nr:GNAT family N-acetyltransferase [Flavobacteriales bacterium]